MTQAPAKVFRDPAQPARGHAVVREFDTHALRRALGRFATGVAVITARDTHARPIGLTINSFASVSLDPPLVAWNLKRQSRYAKVFAACSHYAVNVLAAHQQALSTSFAASEPDPFDSMPWHDGYAGCPLLDGCCAQFVASNEQRYPGGDHHSHLGRVVAIGTGTSEPLQFFGSRYRRLEAQE